MLNNLEYFRLAIKISSYASERGFFTNIDEKKSIITFSPLYMNYNIYLEVLFEVKRLNKIEKVKIKTISIESYHKNHVSWPCHVKVKNNLVLIEKSAFEYQNFDNSVENGYILLSIDSEKISSEFDFGRVTSKYKPGDNVEFKIKKKDKSDKIEKVKKIEKKSSSWIKKKEVKENKKKLK